MWVLCSVDLDGDQFYAFKSFYCHGWSLESYRRRSAYTYDPFCSERASLIWSAVHGHVLAHVYRRCFAQHDRGKLVCAVLTKRAV